MTYVEAKDLANGTLIFIHPNPNPDPRICKVIAVVTAKAGKHGSAKAILSRVDIISTKHFEICVFLYTDFNARASVQAAA